jgi:hypothetical protein
MRDVQITLKTVASLLGSEHKFLIPSYQRGYRWDKTQVEALLDDLLEFTDNGGAGSFYCLQPVVIQKRKMDGKLEVIDGQQRLTTIYLILQYVRSTGQVKIPELFEISYETRQSSESFLKNIETTRSDDNVDFHYISVAYEAIKQWFSDKKSNCLFCLTNRCEDGRTVKFIWVDLSESDNHASDNPIATFSRLNSGKIRLTDAELIRALFLRSARTRLCIISETQRLKIALEWDGIEKALQGNDFWAFIYNDLKVQTSRIEFIFELMAREEGIKTFTDDRHEVFQFFASKLTSPRCDLEKEWEQVMDRFMTLEGWCNDRTLYHLIGFLVYANEDVTQLRRQAGEITKSEFNFVLKRMIFEKVTGKKFSMGEVDEIIPTTLKKLVYGDSDLLIRHFLLLFNLATVLENTTSNLRLSFFQFKKTKWDIEHIRSTASGQPDTAADRIKCLQGAVKYFNDMAKDKRLRAMLSDEKWCEDTRRQLEGAEISPETFTKLYERFLSFFEENVEMPASNEIGNLTLLDKTTNRGYKNAPFLIKRAWVLALDEGGKFVLPCTRDVFLKCFNEISGNLLSWSEPDSTAYRQFMIKKLTKFFNTERDAGS